jgi:hypothetical protein
VLLERNAHQATDVVLAQRLRVAGTIDVTGTSLFDLQAGSARHAEDPRNAQTSLVGAAGRTRMSATGGSFIEK